MPRSLKPASRTNSVKEVKSESNEQYVRVRVKALEIPPVKDGIVIGKLAPIGAESMMRTLKLMSTERFVHFTVAGDDIYSDLIVREAIVKKLNEERLQAFVSKRIKPLMAPNELLMLDMEIEVIVEDNL